MLLRLNIRNYAIIEAVEMRFDKGLNMITGETGAGKSILMGALGLILGRRADTQVLRNPQEKCVVEAFFSVQAYQLQPFFEENDLDYADECIIRREINPAGKSRAFVNDLPVNLDLLKELTAHLVDIVAQHETQSLLREDFYLDVLDNIAGIEEAVQSYSTAFRKYQTNLRQLTQLKNKAASNQKEADFLQFQVEEFANANIQPETDLGLEEELRLMQHAEHIQMQMGKVTALLDEGEWCVLNQLREINRILQTLAGLSAEMEGFKEKNEEVLLELREMSKSCQHLAQHTHFDQERFQWLQDRTNLLNKLMQKHQCSDIVGLLSVQQSIENQLQSIIGSDEEIVKLERETAEQKDLLTLQAKEITHARKEKQAWFERQVSDVLKDIGMPFGFVTLNFSTVDLTISGMDAVELYFSPNKGIAPKTLQQVGSGGEKSRLMLAIKSVVADNMSMPTMIFDEIDTGISGEVAIKVGQLFRRMTRNHQLIAITHLPQVAAKADAHFFVYKDHGADITATMIKSLTGEERIVEIAKMLSGDQPTKAALENAKDLVEQ